MAKQAKMDVNWLTCYSSSFSQILWLTSSSYNDWNRGSNSFRHFYFLLCYQKQNTASICRQRHQRCLTVFYTNSNFIIISCCVSSNLRQRVRFDHRQFGAFTFKLAIRIEQGLVFLFGYFRSNIFTFRTQAEKECVRERERGGEEKESKSERCGTKALNSWTGLASHRWREEVID